MDDRSHHSFGSRFPRPPKLMHALHSPAAAAVAVAVAVAIPEQAEDCGHLPSRASVFNATKDRAVCHTPRSRPSGDWPFVAKLAIRHSRSLESLNEGKRHGLIPYHHPSGLTDCTQFRDANFAACVEGLRGERLSWMVVWVRHVAVAWICRRWSLASFLRYHHTTFDGPRVRSAHPCDSGIASSSTLTKTSGGEITVLDVDGLLKAVTRSAQHNREGDKKHGNQSKG